MCIWNQTYLTTSNILTIFWQLSKGKLAIGNCQLIYKSAMEFVKIKPLQILIADCKCKWHTTLCDIPKLKLTI